MSTLLEIKGLYGGYEQGVNILQGIDLTVAEGEIVGIIGLNGSGKSTLGKAIMNLLPYRSGSIVFDGRDVTAKRTHELSAMGIAMMQQGGAVFPYLSVWQNLCLAWGSHSDKDYRAQLEQVIPLLRQPKQRLMRTQADTLSGGQRHELALAMTLARKPRFVILDEPSAGLSPIAVEEMYGTLETIKQTCGLTILLIEQNISRAVAFGSRCEMVVEGTNRYVFRGNNKHSIEEIQNVLFNEN